MKVFKTGEAGDLGRILAKQIVLQGDKPVYLIIRLPNEHSGIYRGGSILDLEIFESNM